MFAAAFGAFDQTLVQILKIMVYHPGVYNQYNLRKLIFPYVDVDYERNAARDGVSEREQIHERLMSLVGAT